MRDLHRARLLLLCLVACRPEPPTRDTAKGETGGGDTAVDSRGDTSDTDSGDPPDTDSAVVDSDTGTGFDSDTDVGGDTVDSDTGPEIVPVVEDLETLAAGKLVGEEGGDAGGCSQDCMSVALGGDVNGDGLADLVVGLAANDRGGVGAGTAYVLYGPALGDRDLSTADGILVGQISDGEQENAGVAVAGAGDVNGDGFDDVLVGAPDFYGGTVGYAEGQAYLVLGPASGERALADADAVLRGCPPSASNGNTGDSVAGAGDVDGDGFDDVLVGASGYGDAYLMSGPITGLVELETDADFTFSGVAKAVAGAGDTNGDGLDDILIGRSTGVALLFLGPLSGDAVGADADTTVTDSASTYDSAGYHPQSAGDLNADGYADILLDAGADDDLGSSSGAVYVFEAPFAASVDVTAATAKLRGDQGGDVAGGYGGLSRAGDLNGDSCGDLVIAAPNTGWSAESHYDGHGTVYILFGPVSGTLSLGDSPIILEGTGDDRAGAPVAGGGDVDGDGIPDILIGGPGDDDGGEDAGAAWLVLGSTLP